MEQGSLHMTVWTSCTIDSEFCFAGGTAAGQAGAGHHLRPPVRGPPPTRAPRLSPGPMPQEAEKDSVKAQALQGFTRNGTFFWA